MALQNQSREEAMESKGQHLKLDCTDRTKDSKEQFSDKAVTSIAAQVSSKKVGFCPDERKGPQGDTKVRKRKYSYNAATWGVALRKPSRQKKKVRAYSPSREWNIRKKAKIRLDKGGKYDLDVMKNYKSKGMKVKKQDCGECKENNISAGNGNVSKCTTTPDVTTDKLLMSDPEGCSDELKNFMKEEINRQVLNGLGDACKSAEIEAVEVEEISNSASNIHQWKNSLPEERQYMAKMRLTVTIFCPVTLRAGQAPAQDFRKPMEDEAQLASALEPKVLENLHGYQSKGVEAKETEFVEGADDIKEPESTGLSETTRKSEFRGPVEPEKLYDGPQLESESSEEVDVPESEFYDFDCNRSEDKFSPGQVWASYDSGRDVMPRDYVQIKKVMSVSPFKLQIALLEPRGCPDWIRAGNSLTCGEFSTENRLRVMDQIDGFSHIMKWEKGQNDLIYIYPVETEVWALYKDWKELDPNKRIKLGYEIVQIVAIEDNLTVSVIPLVNFKGSRTVFVRQEVEPFKIHKSGFVRFSHQIATYEILDLEGCMELDPAATPH